MPPVLFRIILQQLLLRATLMLAFARRMVIAPPALPAPVVRVPLMGGGGIVRRRRRVGIPRVRFNVLGMSAQRILTLYRFDFRTIQVILEEIEDDISPNVNICTAIPPLLKLLCTLHFCATGTFQHTISLLHGLVQSSFSRILWQVVAALVKRVDHHIFMPVTDAEMTAAKTAFFAIAGFPGVFGSIDCTHIGVVPPNRHESAFRNRKLTHTMNVQMVCAANLTIIQICARFPGSAHDSRILRESSLFQHMEEEMEPYTYLLGDGGYALMPWLMTPLRNPQTPAEVRYNASHIKTRNTIERAFGLLKARFRCLDRTGGALYYSPQKITKIILVCTILHNIAIRRRVPLPEAEPVNPNAGDVNINYPLRNDGNAGRAVRDYLIANHFS